MRRSLNVFTIALCVALSVATSVGAGVASAHTKAASSVSAHDDSSTSAVETLLSSISAGTRETCYRSDLSVAFSGKYQDAAAGIECDNPADGIEAQVYFQFDDAAALADAYTASHPAGLSTVSDVHSCDGTDTWFFTRTNTPGGDFACFAQDDGSSRIVWTATPSNILGLAEAPDGTALKKWWDGSSGPQEKPEDVTNFATGTSKEHKTASKALLAGSGLASSSCKSKLDHVAPGDAEWAWSAWLQAAESCKGPQDASVYLSKLDPASAKAYEAYYEMYNVVGDKKTSKPKGCAQQDVTNHKKQVVGALGCLMVGKELWALWYTSDDGIVGAVQLDGTPKQLFAYIDQHHLL